MAKAEQEKIAERRLPFKIRLFFKETIGELRKVSWPTRQEAWNLTKVVLLVVAGMGVFLGLLDFIFSQVFALLFS